MAATESTGREGLRPRQRAAVPWWVVAVAFGLIIAHNIDEGFVHPEKGGKLSLAGNVLLGVVVVLLYIRVPRWWRAGLTGLLGGLAAVQGLAGHVWNVLSGDAVPLDYSGFLYLAGGLLLIAVAVVEVRGGPAQSRLTRPRLIAVSRSHSGMSGRFAAARFA